MPIDDLSGQGTGLNALGDLAVKRGMDSAQWQHEANEHTAQALEIGGQERLS